MQAEAPEDVVRWIDASQVHAPAKPAGLSALVAGAQREKFLTDQMRTAELSRDPRQGAASSPTIALARAGAPLAVAPVAGKASKSYCYMTDASTFRLDVGGDGRATFLLDSWQDGGHSCGGSGTARPTATGWLYEERLNGKPCKMEILPGKDGGLVLSDADWGCKATLCGQRAVIDGLKFPRSSQVNCASLPVQ